MRTVLSCDFEHSMCGFTSSNKWQRSRGSAETKINVSGFMQPPYGYRKGTYFVYPVMSGLHPGSRSKLFRFHSNFLLSLCPAYRK